MRIRAFLCALDATGSVGVAAQAAGMSRQSAYRLRTRRADFAALWDMAERAGRGFAPKAAQDDRG